MRTILNQYLKMHIRWRLIIFGIYLIGITYLSLAPSSTFKDIKMPFAFSDKTVHFFMYGFFVIILRWTINGNNSLKWKYLWVLIASIFYGVLMEFLQFASRSFARSFEVGDIIADSLGAFIFWIISNWLFNYEKQSLN